MQLPANMHWCMSMSCEEGTDVDREDYPTVCAECNGTGYFECLPGHDLDCEEHNPSMEPTS